MHQAMKSNIITHSILLKHALDAYRKMFHRDKASREERVRKPPSFYIDTRVRMGPLFHAVSVALEGGLVRNWYSTEPSEMVLCQPYELRMLRLQQTGRDFMRLFMTTLAYLDVGCLVGWPSPWASRSALVCRAFVHSSLFLPSAEEMCRSAEKLVCAKSIDRSVRRARLVSANFHHRCWDLYLRVYNISCLPVASRR